MYCIDIENVIPMAFKQYYSQKKKIMITKEELLKFADTLIDQLSVEYLCECFYKEDIENINKFVEENSDIFCIVTKCDDYTIILRQNVVSKDLDRVQVHFPSTVGYILNGDLSKRLKKGKRRKFKRRDI